VGILAAISDKRIKALGLISPGVLYKDYMERRFGDYKDELSQNGSFLWHHEHSDGSVNDYRITAEYLKSKDGIDYIELIKNLHIPILLVCATNETESSQPDAVRQLYESANSPKEFRIVDGAEHNYRNPEKRNELVRIVVDYFRGLES